MFKKSITTVLLTFFGVLIFNKNLILAADSDYTIDVTNATNGTISIGASAFSKPVKVEITKDGTKYQYTLSSTNSNIFPLQMGNGTYKITVYEHMHDAMYRPVKTEEVTVTGLSDDTLYTNPIQLIDFSPEMAAIQALNGLLAGSDTSDAVVEKFHDDITASIAYDYAKAANMPSNYLPVIDSIYSSKKGICFDYAALLASALRANGIPAKLQMGYSTKVKEYHAWNEIKLGGNWYKVDCTYDAQARQANVSFTLKKDDSNFTVVKEY